MSLSTNRTRATSQAWLGIECPGRDQGSSKLKRTSSVPDIRPSRRNRSNTYCPRSTGLAIPRANVGEILNIARKDRLKHVPRPNPIGMDAQNGDRQMEEANSLDVTRASKNGSSQSLDIEMELNSDTEQDFENGAEEDKLGKERKRELAFMKLRSELDRAHQELRKRDDECKKLSRVRDNLDSEVEELTACLFEEANKMVFDAKSKQASAEMQLKEATMKLDGLQAEVNALKLLVITSTPSNPGKKGHRRAPSADQICVNCQTYHSEVDATCPDDHWTTIEESLETKEVDRLVYRNFIAWLEKHCPMSGHPFLEQIEAEDVLPCLRFSNEELSLQIHKGIIENTLQLEAVNGTLKPRRCSLTKASTTCGFRIQVNDNERWCFISDGCRARIVAVANLYTYLRYINQGLIRKEANAMYWEIIRKRGKIALARLGLSRD